MTEKLRTFEAQRRKRWPGKELANLYAVIDARDEGVAAKDRRIEEWKERAERAETQLAGCGVAALGWNQEPAKQGDWGWSASYQDVLTLRRKWEALQAQIDRVRALAEKWKHEANTAIKYGDSFKSQGEMYADELLAAPGEPAATPERKQP